MFCSQANVGSRLVLTVLAQQLTTQIQRRPLPVGHSGTGVMMIEW